MPRKKPFSGKQKKEQMKDKKNRKKDGPKYLQASSESDDDCPPQKVVSFGETSHVTPKDLPRNPNDSQKKLSDLDVQKINIQPQTTLDPKKMDPNSFRLHFFKESDEVVRRKKKDAQKPVKAVDEIHLEYSLEDVYPPTACLHFPKRPPWSYNLSKEKLDSQEKKYFNSYLQSIISQPRAQDLSFFEVNLETWRQLWRVMEISDVLVVIADIRYPVLHISPSLLTYITEELHKHVVIVLNKVDFVPAHLAVAWKRYFTDKFPGVSVVFFSSFPRDLSEKAVDATGGKLAAGLYKKPFKGKQNPVGPVHLMKACKDIVKEKVDLSSWEELLEDSTSRVARSDQLSWSTSHTDVNADNTQTDTQETAAMQTDQGLDNDADTSKQSHQETHQSGPYDAEKFQPYKNGILTLGMIGYPNVGKSSVLNALVDKKVVSVSQTPGHTKHLQTIFLTPTVRLCDCPGLVFPSMVPKSLQVVAGIFPVAQVREPYSVVNYLAKRMDLPGLLKLKTPYSDLTLDRETGQYIWSALDICEAWAIKNGFRTAKANRPDVYRAANKILRLAVTGELCLYFRPMHYSQMKDEMLNLPETVILSKLLTTHSRSFQTALRENVDMDIAENDCCEERDEQDVDEDKDNDDYDDDDDDDDEYLSEVSEDDLQIS